VFRPDHSIVIQNRHKRASPGCLRVRRHYGFRPRRPRSLMIEPPSAQAARPGQYGRSPRTLLPRPCFAPKTQDIQLPPPAPSSLASWSRECRANQHQLLTFRIAFFLYRRALAPAVRTALSVVPLCGPSFAQEALADFAIMGHPPPPSPASRRRHILGGNRSRGRSAESSNRGPGPRTCRPGAAGRRKWPPPCRINPHLLIAGFSDQRFRPASAS